jgi:hypothetical protein
MVAGFYAIMNLEAKNKKVNSKNIPLHDRRDLRA